uniref:Reverse transcriptase domain-containing protein n=1 Tax=Tanacetum cinerariifolium TaxID=118510 RepID=A0A6L2M1V1_TANCI|nr:reverse transcriptase domain-containing protein [Tanacetum cinerariifolium]
MADRTMEELLKAPTEGYGEAIVILEILAENFEIKTNLLQLVQANKFYGFERDNPHTHISNFKRMTATLKYRDVPNDAIKIMLFPYSLEGASRIWYEKEPPNSILTWDDLVNKFVNQLFPPSKTTTSKMKSLVPHKDSRRHLERLGINLRKCLEHISNLVEIVNKQVITPASAKAFEKTFVTCGGAHAYYDCIATDGNQSSVCAATGSYNHVSPPNRASHQIPPPGFAPVQNNPNRGDFNKQEENLRRNLNNDIRSILGSFFQNQASTSGTFLSNTVPNPRGKMKSVTTRSSLAYEGSLIPTNSPLEKVVEQDTKETMDKEHSNCQGSTAQVQPSAVPIFISKPNVPRTQPKPTIPYPSRLNDQKLREKATNQIDKLFELAKVPLNESCSAMLLKKLPEKLGDSGKFLIPCDFPGIEVCHALVDLGASINLMPLLIWKKLLLPELTPSRMILELADRSITRPKGVAEDVFVHVGKFHFPTNFVVVDFKADPRIPLILGRSFLRIGRALIDVYGEEITLRVNDESVTFKLNQTMRYSLTYDDTSVNRVDVIDIACEEFVQDVLDFQYNPKSSNPTLVSENDFSKEPIVKSSSPTLTPFGESDFFLEEIKHFLNDDSIPTGIENFVYDPEGDILFLEKLLNKDPFQLPPMDLKLAKETMAKSPIEEPPELELKELPSHLEYAFLEDSNKLPIIIAKDLKNVEKEAPIKVLKSHKRAIAWKISDIKGIDLRFCTHKILMEEDYKPAVQSQRRVNPKIHDAIKMEVIKLLDTGMIYPISDSPWVSPIHCVPKKGGITVVANENNELIPTRLVTGWRVCIDYRKLNDATRKDNFLEGIDLGYKISKSGIEVYRAKVDVIAKLPHPTTVKEASILVVLDWNLPFELMCDASDFEIGAVLGQCKMKHFQPIHYASKTMTEAQIHYTTPEKEMLAVVYAFEKAIISDHGTYFCNDQFPRVMIKYGVTHRLATTYHPQTSGQVETPIGCTPYKLVYGKSCHLPIELEHRAHWALKHINFDLKTAGDHCKLQLNELSELRDQAYENSVIYKEMTKKLHDSKIKNRIFNVGDQILLFNSRLKIFSGKLKTHWSGPFTITQVFPYGTVELSQPNGPNFKVNGHRVKHYFGGDIPSTVVLDLHTFPMDK